jgi:hypothetical protein
MLRLVKSFIMVICLVATTLRGDYIISLSSGGTSNITAKVGEKFSLDVVLSSSSTDSHNSAIFRVIVSAPGLVYESYRWMEPYSNGTSDDDSKPILNALPANLTTNTLSGTGYSNNVIDFELSNVATPKLFSSGNLVRMEFSIPTNYTGPDTIQFQIAPDTFANKFTPVPTQFLQPFVLNIPKTYLLWRNRTFSNTSKIAPGDDADADGLNNIVEYAFGLDPLNSIDKRPCPSVIINTNQTIISFSRAILPVDLHYQYEYSTNLVQWKAMAKGIDYQENIQTDANVDKENVTLIIPGKPLLRSYFRIKIFLE